MLLLFGLALILNVSTSAAANVTADHTSPKVIAVDPVKNAVIQKSQTVKVTFNEQIKAGNNLIYLKKGNTNVSTTKTISGTTLSITPTTALATGIKYKLILNPGSVTDISGNKVTGFTSSFTVSPITLAQMKDGLSRAQKFYNTNQRLPNYVSYGSTNVPIAQFQKIIATQGLTVNTKIKTTSSNALSSITLVQMKDGLSRAQNFFNNYQRLPNYVSYGSTNVPIAQFQKIIATQGLTVNTKIKTTSSNALSSNASLAQIMKSASKFRYSGAAHTGVAMERIGSGDCWAMSDYLYTHMTKAGMTARIIQYATAYSSNHRSVQYRQNNSWVNAPYRTYFSINMFNNTQSNGLVIRG